MTETGRSSLDAFDTDAHTLARTVTIRGRFADLRAVTRSVTFATPISATTALAEIAEGLVRAVLAQSGHKPKISLLGVRVSHLTNDLDLQLALPLGIDGDGHEPHAVGAR